MSTSLILMIVCFLALMVIGLPIAYNLLITTVVYLLSADLNIVQLAIKMYGGMNSFSFLAVCLSHSLNSSTCGSATSRALSRSSLSAHPC